MKNIRSERKSRYIQLTQMAVGHWLFFGKMYIAQILLCLMNISLIGRHHHDYLGGNFKFVYLYAERLENREFMRAFFDLISQKTMITS